MRQDRPQQQPVQIRANYEKGSVKKPSKKNATYPKRGQAEAIQMEKGISIFHLVPILVLMMVAAYFFGRQGGVSIGELEAEVGTMRGELLEYRAEQLRIKGDKERLNLLHGNLQGISSQVNGLLDLMTLMDQRLSAPNTSASIRLQLANLSESLVDLETRISAMESSISPDLSELSQPARFTLHINTLANMIQRLNGDNERIIRGLAANNDEAWAVSLLHDLNERQPYRLGRGGALPKQGLEEQTKQSWGVNMGKYDSLAQAHQTQASMKNQGFEASVREDDSSPVPAYLLRIDGFESAIDAKTFLITKVVFEEYDNAWISYGP